MPARGRGNGGAAAGAAAAPARLSRADVQGMVEDARQKQTLLTGLETFRLWKARLDIYYYNKGGQQEALWKAGWADAPAQGDPDPATQENATDR